MANILYRKQKQQKSLDNGVTWIDTGEYRVGAVLENPSNCSGTDTKQCRWVDLDTSEGYYCDGNSKYTIQVEECTENGLIWTRTGNSKKGNTLIDSTSIECGYIPNERWVVSGNPIVCECGSVIFYEYKELYDDGVWTPTGEKRESEDFALTSGWNCYEESWDDGTDEYSVEIIDSIEIDYNYLLDYLYYDNKFIVLTGDKITSDSKRQIQYGDNTYNLNGIYLNKLLYMYNNLLYLSDDTTLYKFNFDTAEIEKVIDGYITYYGYDIIYTDKLVPTGNALTFWVLDLTTNTRTNSEFIVSSPDKYFYRNMVYNKLLLYDYSEMIVYEPCMKKFSREYYSYNIGIPIGKGVTVNPSDLTDYGNKQNIIKKSFYIVNGENAIVKDSQVTSSYMSIYYIHYAYTETTLRWKFYHNNYRESKHYETDSFIYKGNTLVNSISNLTSASTVVNYGIFNLEKGNETTSYYAKNIKLMDDENLFCGVYADNDLCLFRFKESNMSGSTLSFTFSGDSYVFLINNNHTIDGGTKYTANTSPYTVTLSELGVNSFNYANDMFRPNGSGVTYGLLTVDSMFDMSLCRDTWGMFQYCKDLTYINLANCNFTFNSNSSYVFRGCSNLKTIDLTGAIYDDYYLTINATTNPFDGCSSLEKIILGEVTEENYNWIYNLLVYENLQDKVTIEYTIKE